MLCFTIQWLNKMNSFTSSGGKFYILYRNSKKNPINNINCILIVISTEIHIVSTSILLNDEIYLIVADF